MLDKSVPYAGLFMCREAGVSLAPYALPDGFRFSFFCDGDEGCWARIESSVLEFGSEFAALLHLKEKFFPHIDELRRRCIFIENSDGVKVATAMAWWMDIEGERRPWLYWVGVDPAYQGLGLGKAVIARATELMVQIEGDVPLYLHTQTWSHKAYRIYLANGFSPTDEKVLYKERHNNYKNAMKILNQIT